MRWYDSTRAAWLSGPAAAALFATSVIGFAAVRMDGYTHATKAVSELGAIGAPNATAFNLLGFIVPGALVVAFALNLIRVSDRKVGPAFLIASGLLMALAGISPAVLDDYQATSTILHVVGAMGTGICWAVALFLVGPALGRVTGVAAWGRMAPWFILFMLANIGWQIAYRATGLVWPGWGQRIGFLGYFLWFAISGFLAWRHDVQVSTQDGPADRKRPIGMRQG